MTCPTCFSARNGTRRTFRNCSCASFVLKAGLTESVPTAANIDREPMRTRSGETCVNGRVSRIAQVWISSLELLF
jgi:hypothetical protein